MIVAQERLHEYMRNQIQIVWKELLIEIFANLRKTLRFLEIFRATFKDYKKSGFDRGHLAPAADHKDSQEAMKETFLLSNMSPQYPRFNQGYWSHFEKYVRNLTNIYPVVYSRPSFHTQAEN